MKKSENNKKPLAVQGKQEEKTVKGIKKLVRRSSEKFQGEIKGVNLDQMHEEYYDVDVLKKQPNPNIQ